MCRVTLIITIFFYVVGVYLEKSSNSFINLCVPLLSSAGNIKIPGNLVRQMSHYVLVG